MNQGNLEVVKQEMVRANIKILAINELKWVGMGKFNSASEIQVLLKQYIIIYFAAFFNDT